MDGWVGGEVGWMARPFLMAARARHVSCLPFRYLQHLIEIATPLSIPLHPGRESDALERGAITDLPLSWLRRTLRSRAGVLVLFLFFLLLTDGVSFGDSGGTSG